MLLCLAASLFLVGACSSILGRVESIGFYATPKGKTPRNEFTRLYIHNLCYENVRITFPKEESQRKGELRGHFIRAREVDAPWINKKGALPLVVAKRKGAPDLTYTPKDIREKAARDEWRTATAFMESYTLTLCPKEHPLQGDEANKTRPATPGEMVDVYVFTLDRYYKRYPMRIALNDKWVRRVLTDDNSQAILLLPAGTKGELTVYCFLFDKKYKTYRIGEDWKARETRLAVAGERVIVEPEPITPKGAWE